MEGIYLAIRARVLFHSRLVFCGELYVMELFIPSASGVEAILRARNLLQCQLWRCCIDNVEVIVELNRRLKNALALTNDYVHAQGVETVRSALGHP